MAGFGVTIVDDREYFASAERFPEARRTVVADFRTAIAGLDITSSTYLLIVTRGHQYDEEILGQALTTPAKYIGMIGSKRKVTTTFGHLLEQGHTAGSLGRVHAPVGLALGALTAEEIAISIVAELISVRRNSGPRGTDIPVGQPGTPRGTDIPVGQPGTPRGTDILVGQPGTPRGTDILVGQPGTPRGTDIPVGHTRSGQ
jgi:xanthine dehydrogenase accessory factor